MSDWKKRNEDWRDEDELEEEEECECPWVDSKGKVRETAYCQYLLEKHPMMCLKQKLFDQNGEVDEDALLYEVHSDLRDFVLDNLAKKEKQVLDALRIETYTPEWKPQLDRIHLQNGTYFLDERGFVPEKELCLNRLPVEYQPDAPAPTKWLEFLDGLLIPEDILTLQEYLGYLLIPSTKAQKMLVMTGKGGEGKSRIGLLLKKLFGEASHSESILRIETNRFAPTSSAASGAYASTPPLLRHKTHEKLKSPALRAPKQQFRPVIAVFSGRVSAPSGRMQGGNTPFGAEKEPGCAPKGRVHPSHAPYKINTERYFCVVWGAWGA